MRTLSSNMNGVSYHEFNWCDSSFMWEKLVRIYDTMRVYNNLLKKVFQMGF